MFSCRREFRFRLWRVFGVIVPVRISVWWWPVFEFWAARSFRFGGGGFLGFRAGRNYGFGGGGFLGFSRHEVV